MRIKAIKYIIFPTLFLLVQNVMAQDSDTLRVINITGQKLLKPSEGYSYLEYDSLVLKDYEHEELTTLLSKESGFFVKSSGPNSLATISIRGLSANHTKLYWNNVSISSPTLGLSDLSLIPASFFNQINVNLGGATIMDGSGAMGGSVNLLNSATKHQGNKFKIGLSYNPTLGLRSKFFSHHWRKKKIEIQSKIILQEATNDYRFLDLSTLPIGTNRRENGELKRYGFNQAYFYSPNRCNEISFKMMYLNNDKNISPAIGVANNFQNQSDEIFRGLFSWTVKKQKFYHAIGISHMNDFSNFTDPIAFINAKFTINGQFLYHHLGYEILPGLVLGSKINVENNKVKSTGFEERISQVRTSILGTVNYAKFKRWGAVISLRKEIEQQRNNIITPSIAMYAWIDKDDKVKLKFNVGQNLRLPTLNDLYWEVGGNLDLKNENSVSGDVGVEYKDESWFGSLTYYSSNTDNWIQWLPNDNSVWSPVNIKKVIAEGIEFGITNTPKLNAKYDLEIGMQYRYGKTVNGESEKIEEELWNKDLILTPRHQFSINAAIMFDDWKINYSQKITSRVYLDPCNCTYLPYSAPASFGIGYHYGMEQDKFLDLTLRVDNIFGEDYQIQANQPMPGRNISILMALNF